MLKNHERKGKHFRGDLQGNIGATDLAKAIMISCHDSVYASHYILNVDVTIGLID